MSKNKYIPDLCKACASRDSGSTFCAAYAFRCAKNDFKKNFTDIKDQLNGTKTEYDYSCSGFIAAEGKTIDKIKVDEFEEAENE